MADRGAAHHSRVYRVLSSPSTLYSHGTWLSEAVTEGHTTLPGVPATVRLLPVLWRHGRCYGWQKSSPSTNPILFSIKTTGNTCRLPVIFSFMYLIRRQQINHLLVTEISETLNCYGVTDSEIKRFYLHEHWGHYSSLITMQASPCRNWPDLQWCDACIVCA